MIPGVRETIKELVAKRGVHKGTATYVRQHLEKIYTQEVVHSKDVCELILQAMEEHLDADKSEDDVDAPAYGSENSPNPTSLRALSIQTSDTGVLGSVLQRERPLVVAASPKKDPEKPVDEGVVWLGSERRPVSCCFSKENINYMGDHVLDFFKDRILLAAERKGNRIALLFRKEGEDRSILIEFEIRHKVGYDVMLSANWGEHKVSRETINQRSIVPKSNEEVRRSVKQDRRQDVAARHRNEDVEADNTAFWDNESAKHIKTKYAKGMSPTYGSIAMFIWCASSFNAHVINLADLSTPDSRNFLSQASHLRGNLPPAPVCTPGTVTLSTEEYIALVNSKDKESDKRKRLARRAAKQGIIKHRRHTSDSDGSCSDEDKLFDKVPPSGSESSITNPESSPATEDSNHVPASWTKPAPNELPDFLYGC